MGTSTEKPAKGFTLIELLVVIAIIAILAAILFPVFARAREQARKISCVSNVRQIALGVAQYVQDYDEKFPWGYNWGAILPPPQQDDPNYQCSNRYQLQPYIKNSKVWICPSDANWTNGTSDQVAWPHGVSYGTMFDSWYDTHYWDPTTVGDQPGGSAGVPGSNTTLSKPTGQQDPAFPCFGGFVRDGLSLAAVRRPSEKGMILEEEDWHDQDPNVVATKYSGRRVVAYVDGHVKFLDFFHFAPPGNKGFDADGAPCHNNIPYCQGINEQDW